MNTLHKGNDRETAAAESLSQAVPVLDDEASQRDFEDSEGSLKGPPNACLFVASLSPSTTEEALQRFFSPYGEIVKTKILKDRSSRPYAFVQFKVVEEANAALTNTHGQTLEGRKLRVEKARVNRTLFIAKIDRSFTNLQVREICEEFGPVESVTIIRNHHTNQSKGCGFVKYQYREDAVEAFTNLKTSNKKLPWVIEWATSTNDPDLQGLDKRNLFLGGLSPKVSKELIEDRFSAYGKIETMTLVNRDTEQTSAEDSRSAFCFLRFESEHSSVSAIEQENGAEWLERRIRVQYCESPEMKFKRRQNKFYNLLYSQSYPLVNPALMMMYGGEGMFYSPYGYPTGLPYSAPQGWMGGYMGGEGMYEGYDASSDPNSAFDPSSASTSDPQNSILQSMASLALHETHY